MCMASMDNIHTFHFKGCYSGLLIKKVVGRLNKKIEIQKEYLVYLEISDFKKGTLYGDIVKIKRLDDLKVSI